MAAKKRQADGIGEEKQDSSTLDDGNEEPIQRLNLANSPKGKTVTVRSVASKPAAGREAQRKYVKEDHRDEEHSEATW